MMRLTRAALSQVPTYTLLVLGAAFISLPFLWLARSVLTPADLLYSPSPPVLPTRITFEHLAQAAFGTSPPFYRAAINSSVVAAIATLSNVVLDGLAAYALARKRFPGRTLVFVLIVAMLALPVESRIIPLYALAANAGMSDTYFGLALPLLVTSFGIFLIRQYLLTVPREIDEAAIIDGCSDWTLYWRIIFPICRPVIAAVAVFTFLTSWNDYFWPLIITNSADMQTLPVMIAGMAVAKDQLEWGRLLAASLLSFLPMLLFYLLMQREFVAGIAGAAVKE